MLFVRRWRVLCVHGGRASFARVGLFGAGIFTRQSHSFLGPSRSWSSVHHGRCLSSSMTRGTSAAAGVTRRGCSVSCLRSSFASGGLCARGGLLSRALVGSLVRCPVSFIHATIIAAIPRPITISHCHLSITMISSSVAIVVVARWGYPVCPVCVIRSPAVCSRRPSFRRARGSVRCRCSHVTLGSIFHASDQS